MSETKRPNFVLVMTDQQRGDCLSLAGHPVLQTPNMDSIGGSGAFFPRAYSTCPSCVPARRSLMTGTFPASNGMVGYRDYQEYDAPATLPGSLKEAGYQTGIVGRNMHMWPRRKRFGFDEMIVTPDDYEAFVARNVSGDPEGAMDHGISGNGWTARPWHMDDKLHQTTWTVTEANRWLKRRDPSCPYFLVVSFIAPHPPLTPPGYYIDRYLRCDLPAPVIGDWAEPPPNDGLGLHVQTERLVLKGEKLRSAQAGYFGLINHVDDQLYRLLSTINKQDTYVLFTSDHGEMLGDHYLFRKTFPYEGSANIPMMISGPGIAPGTVCRDAVCLEDIMPTVLELAGLEIPETVDGASLAPVLRGEAESLGREFLHGEHGQCYSYSQANHYVTDGKIKYIWLTGSGEEQLFDLTSDPGECTNLAGLPEHQELLETWRGHLIARLTGRPEGFTDGKKLIAGRPHDPVMPEVAGGFREGQ